MSIIITDRSIIAGFSRLGKEEKLEIIAQLMERPEEKEELLRSFFHQDPLIQKRFDEFSENTVSNFFFPYGIAPHFLINGKSYVVPMVIEESSVVAAASKAAKFWSTNGGFHAEVVDNAKVGQVHFLWKGSRDALYAAFPELHTTLIQSTRHLTANMERRGGGIKSIELVDKTSEMEYYYQIKATFNTVDSMGANFINSCLEEFARTLPEFLCGGGTDTTDPGDCQVIMSILSNYSPDCRVRCWVQAPLDAFEDMDDSLDATGFVDKFMRAARIAEIDIHRAATHNKGIFNGIDAVALATGNDFRALEAGGHVWASRSGQYRSLTHAELKDGIFTYTLELPMSLGTVGGLTRLHPLADLSLELLGDPRAEQLMMIAAAVGLANNFSALRSLVTNGIQLGHMKMHLLNILNHYQATDPEKEAAVEHFKTNKVTFSAVSTFLAGHRSGRR
ncbi:MAG: hydroxymethylglutaryl-CoA reductase, degradative [Bacteroidales bacterium]|nr:hydroxymethylglutaryl-CoA reductase, degradative [Bacteroidales bacterium]